MEHGKSLERQNENTHRQPEKFDKDAGAVESQLIELLKTHSEEIQGSDSASLQQTLIMSIIKKMQGKLTQLANCLAVHKIVDDLPVVDLTDVMIKSHASYSTECVEKGIQPIDFQHWTEGTQGGGINCLLGTGDLTL